MGKWFKSEGTLLTDPPSDIWNGNDSSRWWAIIQCDPSIGEYYRWLLKKKNWEKLMLPAWGSHVSVVRGECPRDQDIWFSHRGTKVFFEYQNVIVDNGSHFWMPARSPQCMAFRKDVGLTADPEIPLHLTLGMIPP